VARHGYAADAPFIGSPRDARYHYSKRFGIESSYRLFEQAIATCTRINGTAAVRGGESPLTERLAVPSLRYVATPGRRLWWWPYKEFVNMIRRAAWTALAVRSGRPRESAVDDRFHR